VFARHPAGWAVTLASSLNSLFAGPSTGLVTGILVVAIGAAGVVVWTLIRLIVDPRASCADDTEDTDEQSLSGWAEAEDPEYDDSYARARGHATG
jgi:hypothetical protein